jgi:4-hydroxythreonine-4-phosphate dehydrogenase
VGDDRVLRQGARDAGVAVASYAVPAVAAIDWDRPGTPVIDLGNIDPASFERGAVSTESGRLTGETLAHAVAMARRGEVDAITFAPLNKAALHGGGWRFPDEHKMFAHLIGHEGHFAEMNVLDGQWMSRVTGHLSMREAWIRSQRRTSSMPSGSPTAPCAAPAWPGRASPSRRSIPTRGRAACSAGRRSR